jgi:hypothetical protein
MARKHSLSMRRRQRSSASENYSHAPSSSPARSGGNGPHHVPGRYVGLGVGLFDSFYGPKERPAGLALGAKDKRQQAAGKARPPADLIVGFALGAVIGAATLHILFFN